jgi:hypothetical protein
MDPMMFAQALGPQQPQQQAPKRPKPPITSRTLPLTARPDGMGPEAQRVLMQLLQQQGLQ